MDNLEKLQYYARPKEAIAVIDRLKARVAELTGDCRDAVALMLAAEARMVVLETAIRDSLNIDTEDMNHAEIGRYSFSKMQRILRTALGAAKREANNEKR